MRWWKLNVWRKFKLLTITCGFKASHEDIIPISTESGASVINIDFVYNNYPATNTDIHIADATCNAKPYANRNNGSNLYANSHPDTLEHTNTRDLGIAFARD
jgi:hypothetical protein